jgi:outer membrane protein assembly factor BamB
MRRIAFALFALLLAALSTFAQTPPPERDPIEGKWWGDVGYAEDRVKLGLQFRRNAQNELKAYLYQPVINFYGLELPGVVKRDGANYELKEYAYSFTLKDDVLEGTGMLKEPLLLHRTETLPSEVPVPELPKGPGPLWQRKLYAPIYATPSVRDGMAYVGTLGSVFHAVSLKDGSIAWTFAAGRPIHGEALVTDDAVYFVCDNGYLFKLGRKSGKELWRYDLGDARVSRVLPHETVYEYDFRAPRPTLADGVLYVGSGDGSLHAVRAASGEGVWRFVPESQVSTVSVGGASVSEKGKVRADAAVDGERVIFGSFDGNLYAVDRAQGTLVWKKDTRARIDSTPVVVDDKIILGNFGGVVYGFNAADGAVAWRRGWWGSAVESTAVPYGDRIYIGASDLRRVTCLDPKIGRVLWRTDVYGWTWSRPLVTEKYIYVAVAGGSPYDIRHVPSLTVLDRITGAIVWRWPAPESGFVYGFVASPAVDRKTVVVGSVEGMLYAFPAS